MTHPIRTFRHRHQLTLEAFAEKLGVTRSIVWRWETGRILPRGDTMRLIERVTAGAVTPVDLVKAYAAQEETR